MIRVADAQWKLGAIKGAVALLGDESSKDVMANVCHLVDIVAQFAEQGTTLEDAVKNIDKILWDIQQGHLVRKEN